MGRIHINIYTSEATNPYKRISWFLTTHTHTFSNSNCLWPDNYCVVPRAIIEPSWFPWLPKTVGFVCYSLVSLVVLQSSSWMFSSLPDLSSSSPRVQLCFTAVNLWGPLGAVLIPQLFIIDSGVWSLSHRENFPECTCPCFRLNSLLENWAVWAGWAWQSSSVSSDIWLGGAHTDDTSWA